MYPLSFEDSSATDRTATLEEFVSDVESVRRYTGAVTATIVGHSMGAAVALQYAVSRLVGANYRMVMPAVSSSPASAKQVSFQNVPQRQCRAQAILTEWSAFASQRLPLALAQLPMKTG